MKLTSVESSLVEEESGLSGGLWRTEAIGSRDEMEEGQVSSRETDRKPENKRTLLEDDDGGLGLGSGSESDGRNPTAEGERKGREKASASASRRCEGRRPFLWSFPAAASHGGID